MGFVLLPFNLMFMLLDLTPMMIYDGVILMKKEKELFCVNIGKPFHSIDMGSRLSEMNTTITLI